LIRRALIYEYDLDGDDLHVSDGGGLSRRNRVTARAMTRLLTALARRSDAAVLLKSLAASGVSGTMRKRLTRPPYRSRVLAKTGYLAGVCCLSGYVVDEAGAPAAAFSILAGDVPAGKAYLAKQLQDRICIAIVDWASAR
jgi:D-alanyl-D-alanine carboxypeptidase/D-alanyl-D-alanine-endopeptidase (penicillin-binding protein 4)